MREAVNSVDPVQSIYDVKTTQERVAATLAVRKFTVVLLELFALTASLSGRARLVRRDQPRRHATDAGNRNPHGAVSPAHSGSAAHFGKWTADHSHWTGARMDRGIRDCAAAPESTIRSQRF
jgi:hypothetical protein